MATVVDWPGNKGDWRDKLMMKPRKGRPPEIMPTFTNLLLILGHDPRLRGTFGYDEFRESPVFCQEFPEPAVIAWPGPFPRPWVEQDISLAHSYVESIYTDKFRSPAAVERALNVVCRTNSKHPVRDWLDGLVWDGEHRLDSWLLNVFGVEPNAYTEAVARKTLIAAVRRVHEPGCKFDHVLVLFGPQDFGKSLALEVLAGEDYFNDSLPLDFADKDAMGGLNGSWFIELAEIEHLERNSAGMAKGFLSRHTDKYRAPYGRSDKMYKRQCIITGTTNDPHFLRDHTGNRRFWPVTCEHKANLNWLRDNREFLFAEAVAMEAADVREQIYIDATMSPQAHAGAIEAQAERLEAHDDPWMQPIQEYIAGRAHVTIPNLLGTAVKLTADKQHSGHARRAAKILKALGGWHYRLANGSDDPYPRTTRYWTRRD
jgi:putative DNA primase/helicase